ncbi:flavin-containing monooxygenase [Aspergillus melleus]|uniref:flavin-containing monooxygenase n=1 Tax=Aspergillus melleus TaxID=138277 RepID=UPI001E8D9592|nr:uncharacterized protein LDX57_002851 [Aspergillus melleus]KAH8425102.1 hypothetical protein LDX57_002851 [Aspergillus melleus]
MPSNESYAVSGHSEGKSIRIDETRFAFTPRKIRVVCIGAGFSGLNLAYKLKHERPLDYVDFQIYEKNTEVGGAWWENVYPGVGWWVYSQNSYQFPFEPSPDWSKFYVGGKEIEDYILRTTEKYGLKERIAFNTRLVRATWNEEQAKWKLQLERGEFMIGDEADILIDGSGIVNNWKWPNVEGLDQFKGKIVHSAKWDAEYQWEGKRIAVIGNGSSGLQLVPALQRKAAKIVNYARRATWVSTPLCGNLLRDANATNFAYTEEEKEEFRTNPEKFLEYRKVVETSVNSVYRLMISGSAENKMLFDLVDATMREKLKDNPELIEKLIPKYELGCRRLSPGNGYLEAIQANNARATFSPIQRITPTGIESEEGEEEFDLIVCATGFDTSFVPSWDLVGRDGRRLADEWKETPSAYFSTCAGGVPNYFMFAGPNCPIGHGSVPQMLAWTGDYMLNWIEKMVAEDIRSIVVKDSVVREYNAYAQESLKRCVWSKGCHAWYSKKNAEGPNTVTAMYPGSVLHFKEYMKTIRGEHFDIRYNNSNQFLYLANGELALERDEGGDMAYYLTLSGSS